jgi:hypothetical protein
MSTREFLESPWKNSHDSYDQSVFAIKPAPEFATAEVVIASLYRSSGFNGCAETDVPKGGRDFDRLSLAARAKKPEPGRIRPDTWHTILHGVLESPKQPNQSSKRFLQLCPIVPDTALYSGSARLAGNSWNPGQLVQRMVRLGSESDQAASDLWNRLFESLSVSDSDDVWARWLVGEFQHRGKHSTTWANISLDTSSGSLAEQDKRGIRYPARQFVRDIEAVMVAKPSMTRRQWISLLEAIVRLGAVTHVLWLCRVNDKLWRATRSVLQDGTRNFGDDQVRKEIIESESRYLAHGKPAIPIIRDYASAYLVSRIGLNLVLWLLDEAAIKLPSLGSSADICSFLKIVSNNRENLLASRLLELHSEIVDQEAKTIACKKNIGSNLIEFSRHALGQRQTANQILRGYDQGYFLRKRGGARNSAWIVSLGPVAVLALVHCCLREAAGPRSVQRLCDHLACYGIEADLDDMSSRDLGQKLRMLGLVLDSPDAESGMLLVPPFSNTVGAEVNLEKTGA